MALVALFSSCSKESSSSTESLPEGVSSQWQLIERYDDPGDGSGGFEPVEGDKYIVFNDDGTLVSYGSLCSTLVGSTEANNGTYDADNFTIFSDECGLITLYYEYQDDHLIVKYPCDEPCHEKYQAITVLNIAN